MVIKNSTKRLLICNNQSCNNFSLVCFNNFEFPETIIFHTDIPKLTFPRIFICSDFLFQDQEQQNKNETDEACQQILYDGRKKLIQTP